MKNRKPTVKKEVDLKPKKADNVNVTVNDNVNDIYNRKSEFKNSLHQFDYEETMLKDFFDYWTEHNEKSKKMRFEKERSWNTELRLKRWFKNQENWKKEKSSAKKEKRTAAEALREKYGISNI